MIRRIDNESLLNLQLISYGAMITSVKVPSKTGEIADVALGFDSIDGELGCCIFRLGAFHK